MCLQVAFGVPKKEVLRVFLQITQLPEAGQASDKAIPLRSSCRQDHFVIVFLAERKVSLVTFLETEDIAVRVDG